MMTRVGDVAVRLVEGAHQKQARQLTRGAGRRLQRRRAMPVIGAELLFQCRHDLEPALTEFDAGAPGCTEFKPGSFATASQNLGLYFIVHEPSGYMPRSTEN